MSYPLTVSMTPAFRYGGDGDWLLRAQLRCLSEQTFKDFDVLIVDPHYSKRKAYMPELAQHYNLHIVHVPYTPNTYIAKRLDCAVFNAAYCYSESPRVVRYSCWRFVMPDFTAICASVPESVDFYFHSCEPKTDEDRLTDTCHDSTIWKIGSDEVHWSEVPQHSGLPGATWGKESDVDAPLKLFPGNAYGNYMVPRKRWLQNNGCDEVFTNAAHYEDIDFCTRARAAGFQCERRAHVLFRLHHWYGKHSGRANELPDTQFKKNCDACESATLICEPHRWDLKRRVAKGEVELFEDLKIWVCKTCFLSAPIYHANVAEHADFIRDQKRTQATILPKYKIGRNLRILTEYMDGKSLAGKVDVYNSSWTDERYYSV